MLLAVFTDLAKGCQIDKTTATAVLRSGFCDL